LRGTADRDRDRVPDRLDVGLEVLEPVELALVADRAVLGPDTAQDLDEFLGAAIALLLGRVVALATHFVIGAAGDDVDPGPAAADPIQPGERLGHLGRVL